MAIILIGEGNVPTKEGEATAQIDLKLKLYGNNDRIAAALKEKYGKNWNRKRSLTEESNELPFGKKDMMDKMFATSQKTGRDNPRTRNQIYQAEAQHNRPPSNWSKRRGALGEWAQEELINQELQRAEQKR